jgi:hypothetical protein
MNDIVSIRKMRFGPDVLTLPAPAEAVAAAADVPLESGVVGFLRGGKQIV